MATTIKAGDLSNPAEFSSDTTGAVVIQTGAAGAKVNAVSIDSAGKVSFPQNQSGSAPFFSARAWVNFNAAGTIRASGNVSGVVKNATGDYTITFATPMPDANYAITGTVGGTAASAVTLHPYDQAYGRTANDFRIVTVTTAGGLADSAQVNIVVFR